MTVEHRPIAFLIDEFPVFSETFVGNEIRAVEALGRSVELFSIRRPQRDYQPVDESLASRTRYLDSISGVALPLSPLRWRAALRFARQQRSLPLHSLLYNGARIARELRRREAHHLHAHFAWGSAAHAIVAARFAGISVSFVGHGSDLFGTPLDLVAKLTHTDLAVATCEDTQSHYRQLVPTVNTAVVPAGIDPTRFSADNRPTAPSRGYVFLARLIERKGLRETLQALAQIPNDERPSLDVIGDGEERAPMEALSKELGLREVEFLGRRPADWLAQQLPRYRALLAPYFEGEDGGRDTGPVVAKEALASGVPVIASTFMGLKEIVDPSCGLLVPPRDVDALAKALRQAAAWSSEEWVARGDAGRRKVLAQFTTRRAAELLCAAIDAL